MHVTQLRILILACALSAGTHAALAPEHFRETTAAGVGFVASAAVLALLAVALTRRPGVLELVAAAAVLAGLLAAYAAAVTTGVPVLHPEREAVDGLAVVTKLIEALGLAAAVARLRLSVPNFEPKGSSA
jgi:hypothetical protein